MKNQLLRTDEVFRLLCLRRMLQLACFRQNNTTEYYLLLWSKRLGGHLRSQTTEEVLEYIGRQPLVPDGRKRQMLERQPGS